MKDYYKVLGISCNAGEEEIKKAYRRLSKQFHPDVNPEAKEQFTDILKAYGILRDVKKRQEYDEQLKRGIHNQEAEHMKKSASTAFQSSPDIDISNMEQQFAQFFGFHPGSQEVDSEMFNKKKKKTNPLDTTEMFEQYMGVKNNRQ